jgi:Acetyltransferase (isoleucine patch superfamily)
MTEKEKMISGEYYSSFDKELEKDREFAKDLCFKFNNLPPSNRIERSNIINELLENVGKEILMESSFYCDYGYNISIGNNFYSNHNLVILDCAKVKIGNNVLIAPNVGIYTAEHPIDAQDRISGLEYAKPIIIGNNVWIGANTCILGGTTIGDNTVIGAGSVVTKDIPANVLALGNPCTVVKTI